MKKIILYIFGALAIIIVILIGYVQFSWNKKYDAPYPDIKASTDSAVIARGRYLAYGPAHCATCHMPMDKIVHVETTGEELPLSGGWELDIPPGTFRAPNLTPDMETGIGKLSDGEIARIMRYMVGADGRCIMPFMPFAEMSDADLTAVISFLRSQPPVKHEVKRSDYKFLGKAVAAFGLIKPEGTKGTPPKSVPIDSTAEYGKYLANYVANCVGCHTERDMKTGTFIGKPFAGGMLFPPDAFSEGKTHVSPNITPHKGTGVMAEWSEAAFVARMKAGRGQSLSPMPWGAFSKINELELKAIYRYLQSLEPVENAVLQTVFEPGEKPQKN